MSATMSRRHAHDQADDLEQLRRGALGQLGGELVPAAPSSRTRILLCSGTGVAASERGAIGTLASRHRQTELAEQLQHSIVQAPLFQGRDGAAGDQSVPLRIRRGGEVAVGEEHLRERVEGQRDPVMAADIATRDL